MARPFVHDLPIYNLHPRVLYTTGGVLEKAQKDGLFPFLSEIGSAMAPQSAHEYRKRARSALANFAARHLPDDPDGYIRDNVSQSVVYPAHYGVTWVSVLDTLQPTGRGKERRAVLESWRTQIDDIRTIRIDQ